MDQIDSCSDEYVLFLGPYLGVKKLHPYIMCILGLVILVDHKDSINLQARTAINLY